MTSVTIRTYGATERAVLPPPPPPPAASVDVDAAKKDRLVMAASPVTSMEKTDLLRQEFLKVVAQRAAQQQQKDEVAFNRTSTALFKAIVACAVFMIAEIVFGVLAHSLAILTDAAHLLTDVGSFFLSLMALHAARRQATKFYTYGWHRAEVVGALFSVFTIWALAGAVTIEAMDRIATMNRCADIGSPAASSRTTVIPSVGGKHRLHDGGSAGSGGLIPEASPSGTSGGADCVGVDPVSMMAIGVFGILVNIGCAYILSDSGHVHSHGYGAKCQGHGADEHDHHGHSHEEEDHHGHATIKASESFPRLDEAGSHGEGDGHEGCHHGGHSQEADHGHSHEADHGHSHEADHGHSHEADHGHSREADHGHSHDDEPRGKTNEAKGRGSVGGLALNAAYIHALGDSIQSAGVIFAGFIIYYFNEQAYGFANVATSRYNVLDPVCSLIFVVVTLFTTRGIVSTLVGILMETTPTHVDFELLKQDLESIPTVTSIHDLHVWSLSADKHALSVHLVSHDHEAVLLAAQKVCHVHGLDHTTIQVDSAKGADACEHHMGCN